MGYVAYFLRKNSLPLLGILISAVVFAAVLSVIVSQRALPSSVLTSTVAKPLSLTLKRSEQLLQALQKNTLDIADILHQEAEHSEFNLDEISYESRAEPDLPLVARNASFTLTSQYPHIRIVLDHLIHQQNNITLSALDCTKDDIEVADVHCAITLTAFQPTTLAKGTH